MCERRKAVRAHFSDAPTGGYQATWFRFDNGTGATQSIGPPVNGLAERLQASADLPQGEGAFVKASISAVDAAHRSWATLVDVYFRRAGGAWQLVAVERLSSTPVAAQVQK